MSLRRPEAMRLALTPERPVVAVSEPPYNEATGPGLFIPEHHERVQGCGTARWNQCGEQSDQ